MRGAIDGTHRVLAEVNTIVKLDTNTQPWKSSQSLPRSVLSRENLLKNKLTALYSEKYRR